MKEEKRQEKEGLLSNPVPKKQCFGSALVSMRIRIQNLGKYGSGFRVLMTTNSKKIKAGKSCIFFMKNCHLVIPRPP
jgi:hypothetical protein